MKLTKKFASLFLAFAVVIQPIAPTALRAQGVGPVTPVVSPGGPIYADSGNYDITQVTQDNARIFEIIMDNVRDVQKEDRDYLQGVAERLNGKLVDLINLRREFQELQQRSSLGLIPFGAAPLAIGASECAGQQGQQIYLDLIRSLEEKSRQNPNFSSRTYLDLVNEINQKSDLLSVEIMTSTVISRAALPSLDQVGIGDLEIDVAQLGSINFEALTTPIMTARDQLLSEMNGYRFQQLITPAGEVRSITSNALNPNLEGFQILTPCQIQYVQNQISRLSVLSAETDGYQQLYADKMVTLLLGIADRAGVREWLRFRNENDQRALVEMFQPITEAFWLRSFLRKKYGVPMGALQPKEYDRMILNLESFGVKDFGLQPLRDALRSFRRERAVSDNELQAAFDNARNFVEMYDQKVTPVFASNEDIRESRGQDEEGNVLNPVYDYSAVETGFLVRANSAITWVTGQRHISEILLAIMRMLLADIREEAMLARGDWAAQISYHDARYRPTSELRSENNRLICQVDFTLSEASFQRNCAEPFGLRNRPERPQVSRGDNIINIFGNLMDQYERVERARRMERTNLIQLLDAALGASRSGSDDRDQDSLFD